MALWNPNESADAPAFNGGLMAGGWGDAAGSLLGALGESLMTSPRGMPFAGFSKALDRQNQQTEQQQSRAAMQALLMKSGMSRDEARAMSYGSPAMASLAIQQQQLDRQTKADQQAIETSNGGVAGGRGGGGDAAPKVSLEQPGEIETTFLGEVGKKVTNPIGLAAVAATGQHESGFSADNINRTWNDPSRSGEPGQAGGAMSWRGPRLVAMQAATAGASNPAVAQAQFFLNENPALIDALNAAKTPEEANGLMAKAWRFAGYDKPGGEVASRLATTQAYAGRFAGGAGQPTQVASADPSFAPEAEASAAPSQGAAATPTDNRPTWAYPVGDEPGAYGSGGIPGVRPRPSGTPPRTAVAGGFTPGTGIMGRPADAAPSPLAGLNGTPATTEDEVQRAERATGMTEGGAVAPAPSPPSTRPARPVHLAEARPNPDARATDAAPVQFSMPGAGAPQGQGEASPAGLFKNTEAARASLDNATRALRTPYISDTARRQLERQQQQASTYLESSTKLQQEMQQRRAALPGFGIDPNSDRAQTYILTGKLNDDTDKIRDDARQREALALQMGLKPNTERYNKFVAGGGYEEAGKISPSDRKAITDAEDQIPSIEGTVASLRRAKALNNKTYTGQSAEMLGHLGTSAPAAWKFLNFDTERANNTREFGQIMSMEAITAMSQTLKGATTDTEMARFMKIMGDPTTPPAIRERTIDRMLDLAEKRETLMKGRVRELRGPGDPTGSGTPAAQAPASRQQAPAFSPSQLEAEARKRGLMR